MPISSIEFRISSTFSEEEDHYQQYVEKCLLRQAREKDFEIMFNQLMEKLKRELPNYGLKNLKFYACRSQDVTHLSQLEYPTNEDQDNVIAMWSQPMAGLVHHRGNEQAKINYGYDCTFPSEILLGHKLNIYGEDRENFVCCLRAVIGEVNWDLSEEKCIFLLSPFEPYEKLRRLISGMKIKNAIIKSKFYEKTCGKLWHPDCVLGKMAVEDFAKRFLKK